MELKDIVLSTLAEIDDDKTEIFDEKQSIKDDTHYRKEENEEIEKDHSNIQEEIFLKNLRERILALFEGFKSPNNKNIEAKVDLTLNFLEYLLATIDARLKENVN
jgi:hypothetical protein